MKKLGFTLAMILLAACNNEVSLYTGGDSVPVVYCLLDPGSSIQHIRLGRSYIGDSTLMARPPEADSLIWKQEYEVYIEEYSGSGLQKTFSFSPDYSLAKDSGFFPAEGMAVYSSEFSPVPGNQYQLYVYFPDLGKMVSGRTTAHGLPTLVDPAPIPFRKINFEAGQPYMIRWYPGEYSGVYECIFRIHYQDSSASGNQFKSADYSSGGIYDLRTDQLLDHVLGGQQFFKDMTQQIPVIQDVSRKVISVEFIMISGGLDLSFLYKSAMESGTNFTNFGDYSNLINGIGIFSSRAVSRVSNLELSNVTIDELAHGAVTAKLNFKDSRGQ
ncbi:MAG: hypothetical protein A2X22_01775 [Bacteroidetes bacterium GWF2_49_14]|nr:MAG: hypothetical protein A2X22_01775 [Bacteroidetes bacterium GWF2_49_14]HBB93422.1 hypothetical protein [Bacteroidales bacterium]